MLKLVKSPRVRMNLYFEDKLIFESIDFFQAIDIRRQIAEMNLDTFLSGYYFKIDSPFWHLFHKNDNIELEVCNICSDGVLETWFPQYYIDEEYGFVNADGEQLKAIHKLFQIQKEHKKKNEGLHPKN